MSGIQHRLSSQKVYFAKLQWKVFQEKLECAEFAADYLQAECFLQSYLLFLDQALWALGLEVASQYDIALEDCSRLYPSSVEMLGYIDDCLQQVEVKSPEISRILLAQQDRSNRLYWLLDLVQHCRAGDLSAKLSLQKMKASNQGNRIALSDQSSQSQQVGFQLHGSQLDESQLPGSQLPMIGLEYLELFCGEVDELIAALRSSVQEY